MPTGPSNPARPARFRVYIDESGDHAYSKMDHLAHRYLALLGVWFKQPDHYTEFADALENLKRQVFGPRPDRPVVLHRSEIINRRGAFGLLNDDAIARRFDEGLIRVVSGARFKMACVVIDKKQHQERYSSPFHPYHYCTASLLERYAGWLNLFNAVGDVMAEARGREEDLQLKQAYRRVFEAGTQWFRHDQFQRALTSRDIKLQPKRANIAGLQLADVLAHPIKQHCLESRGIIPAVLAGYGRELVVAASPKFNCQVYQGRVDGYGRVYL